MEIVTFGGISAYDRSMRGFYKKDGAFKNNKSPALKIVSNPGGAFFRNSIQKMIGVMDGWKIRCQCVLIKHKAYDALTVGFFEAEEGAFAAVSLMMDYAESLGQELGCKRLEVSLDGHCNYSVGFLWSEAEAPPLFGESYNPRYYHDFFACGYTKITFQSFRDSLDNIYSGVSRLLPGIKRRSGEIRLTCADFRRFAQTMKRYTDLSNAIFASHRYCFYRAYDEDLELFASMKPLLGPCNLIFASKNGIDIGFILLYPDFNELTPAGGRVNAGTWIRHKLLHRPIRTIKIAEMGVLPEYRANGTILLLFAEGLRQIKSHYPNADRVVSSWILDENTKSINLTSRFAKRPHKRFAAYEKEL